MKQYDEDRLLSGHWPGQHEKQGIYLSYLITDRADDRVWVAHFFLEKRANRTTWKLSWSLMVSRVSPTTQLSHHTLFPPVHVVQALASIQLALLLSNRKRQFPLPGMLVTLATFYNPTYQLNFSTRCFEVLQYSWKKKNSALISYGCQ